MPKVLSDAKISSLPDSAFYIPNFLTEAEERLILDKVRLFTQSVGAIFVLVLTVDRSTMHLFQPGVSCLIADCKPTHHLLHQATRSWHHRYPSGLLIR